MSRPAAKCPCEGGTTPRFVHPAVLALLAEGECHGYDIVRRLAAMPLFAEDPPKAPGVYRLLKDMEAKGYCNARWQCGSTARNRHCYRLTAAGRRCLASWQKSLSNHRAFVADLQLVVADALGAEGGSGDGGCGCGEG